MVHEVLKEIEKKPGGRQQHMAAKQSTGKTTSATVVPKARQIKKSELGVGRKKSQSPAAREKKSTTAAAAAAAEKVAKEWPPKKFRDVESSGYGTTWAPPTVKRASVLDSSTAGLSTLKRSSSARSLSARRTASSADLNRSLESTKSANDQEISHLKG